MAGRSKPKRKIGRRHLEDFISSTFEEDVHAKRVERRSLKHAIK